MAVVIGSDTRNAKTHALVYVGPPRVEGTLSTIQVGGVDGQTSLRLTIAGAADPAELVQVLQVLRNKIIELYGLA